MRWCTNYQNVHIYILLCNFIEIELRHRCSPVNLLHIFRKPAKNTSEGLLLHFCELRRHFSKTDRYWVRLNYATTHHDPPPSTTTHHQPKYVHHHPPPAKIYPPLPTISQKMDHHPAKAKMYSYITSFRHCFNSFFSSKCNVPFRDGDFVW